MMEESTWRRPGFSIPGNASAAGRKAHALGLAHQWTADEAREMARRGGRARADRIRVQAERKETEAMA